MPDPSYKSETAAMNDKAKELRAKVKAAAKQKNVSVPKSALDNFIDTYKKTKVGPIQRAISKFLSGFNTKADYTSGKSTTAKLTTKAMVNRATSQGGRSRANVIEEKQKKLAAESAAQGGGSVLSQRKKPKPKTKVTNTKTDAKPKASMSLPVSPPQRPKKKLPTAVPKSKPKQENKSKVKAATLDMVNAAAKKSLKKKQSAAASWKDYKSVSAAQKAGSDYFMGRDGKKKIAVTKEQLGNKSLTEYANKLKKKGK